MDAWQGPVEIAAHTSRAASPSLAKGSTRTPSFSQSRRPVWTWRDRREGFRDIVLSMPAPAIDIVTLLARRLQQPGQLEDVLKHIVEATAGALDAPRASLRILDPARRRLVAVCRTGEPLHLDPDMEYAVGEGLMGWIAQHVEAIRTGDAEADPRFVERHDRREPVASFVGAPVVSGSICLGVLAAVHPDRDRFTGENELVLRLIATISGPFIEQRRFSHLTAVDPLTSAITRRGLEVVLPDSRISDAGELPVSLVMVDLDRFREVNDEHGCVVGDQVLREVSKILASLLGAGDALVRYGGEEFLMILPGVDLAAARGLGEQARRAIQSAHLRFHGVHVGVTASFGVAERRRGESRTDLIRRADAALAAAKNAGRNRVEAGP
jgi:diguanylate cyclase (GGDEF)-like protein